MCSAWRSRSASSSWTHPELVRGGPRPGPPVLVRKDHVDAVAHLSLGIIRAALLLPEGQPLRQILPQPGRHELLEELSHVQEEGGHAGIPLPVGGPRVDDEEPGQGVEAPLVVVKAGVGPAHGVPLREDLGADGAPEHAVSVPDLPVRLVPAEAGVDDPVHGKEKDLVVRMIRGVLPELSVHAGVGATARQPLQVQASPDHR